MIRFHNRDYVNFIGFCDIRPSQQARAVKEFSNHKQYAKDDVEEAEAVRRVKKQMLADPEVEMVVIALPLWLHAPVAIEAMKAGKHVFCEKLMAHSIAECKEMCKVAREKNKLLAIGHQRHYSVLYDNANYLRHRTACSATSAISAPSGTATTPARGRRRTRTASPIFDPETGQPEYRPGREGEHRLPR